MKVLSKLNSLDNVEDGSTRKLITKTESSGAGNVVTSVSVSGDTITYTKGATALTSHQNAFSNIKVGSSTVAADQAGDTLELVAGSNITLTPDTTNDKVTIAATDTNTTYTLSADTTNNKVVLTPSSGTAQSITVPYATKATGDKNGNDITTTYLPINYSYSGETGSINWGYNSSDGQSSLTAEITNGTHIGGVYVMSTDAGIYNEVSGIYVTQSGAQILANNTSNAIDVTPLGVFITGLAAPTNNNDAANKKYVDDSVSGKVSGSGTSGYLTKWNGSGSITNGPQLGNSTSTYLRNDGQWETPANTTYTLSADTTNNQIKLTPSSGSVQSITVPFATNAKTLSHYTISRNNVSDTWFRIAYAGIANTYQEKHALIAVKGTHNSNEEQMGILALDATGGSSAGVIASYGLKFISASKDLNVNNFFIEYGNGSAEHEGEVFVYIKADTNNYASWQFTVLQTNGGWTFYSGIHSRASLPTSGYTGKNAVVELSDLAYISKGTGSSKFLREDGTWQTVSSGSSTDVQINGTSITSSNVANIITNSAYNASSNKIATMNDLPGNYYPTTWTWTNGTSSGPTASLSGSGMSAVSVAAIPAADGTTKSGIVTTGNQTFGGVKTFSSAPKLSTNTLTTSSGYTVTIPNSADTLVNLAGSQALTNKTYNGYTLSGACAKSVDTSISAGSSSANLPTSAAVASFVEGKGYAVILSGIQDPDSSLGDVGDIYIQLA